MDQIKQSIKYSKKLKSIIKLLIIFITAIHLLYTFFPRVNAVITCSISHMDTIKYPYEQTIEPLFYDNFSKLLCRILENKYFCLTHTAKMSDQRKAALTEYFSYEISERKNKDYSHLFKTFNKKALKHYCSNEVEHRTMLSWHIPCPSALRFMFPKALMECANWETLPKKKPIIGYVYERIS